MEDKPDITHISEKLQLETFLPSTKNGIVFIDSNGSIINANASAAKLLGTDFAMMSIGNKIYDSLQDNDIKTVVCNFLLNGNDMDQINYSRKNKKSSIVLFKKLIKAEDKLIGYMLKIKKESLGKKYNEMAEGFVASVSHELKTPLTLIMGAVETLEDGAINNAAEAKYLIEIIKKHAERLNMLICDLLSIGRLEENAADANLAFTEINLHDLIFNSVKLFEYIAKDKNLNLEAVCEEHLFMKGNQTLIEQALINLIDNACKYSNEGCRVSVRAFRVSKSIHVEVKDTGIGIAEKDQIKIFERFYRVDKEISRNMGGTGLGLSIVKQIIRIHGGSISLTSSPGDGSAFTMIFHAE